MDLQCTTHRVGSRTVLAVVGLADLSTAPELHSALHTTIAECAGEHVVVDLDGVTGLDDAALGLLLGAAMRARERGGLVELVCSDDRLRRRLASSRLDELVEVRSSIGRPVTPSTGYTAVIFTNQRVDDAGDDDDGYDAEASRMEHLAAEQPGFLGIDSVRRADGVGITVSYWASTADATAWKRDSEHLLVQRAGRERWYRWYRVRVATVERDYSYHRHHVSDDEPTSSDGAGHS